MTLDERLALVRARLDSWEVDALLVTSVSNRVWLSGFSGSSGQLIITRDGAYLATDSRYWEQMAQQAPSYELFKTYTGKRDVSDLLRELSAKRIGIEAAHVTVGAFDKLMQSLPDLDWNLLPSTVEDLRQQKSADEIAIIRQAAALSDRAVYSVPKLIRQGMSERELAWKLEQLMREAGADAPGFDIIVASGPNAALPHHHPGERCFETGDTIVVDLGAELALYRSDITRSFHLGLEPEPPFWEIYNLVKAANERAIDGSRAGMSGSRIDALARDVIVEGGYGEEFGHGLGHGVGLEIHEEPYLRSGLDVEIPPNAVVTIEPGIYVAGWGGVRLEDLVVFGEAGVEVLSQAPKSPLISI